MIGFLLGIKYCKWWKRMATLKVPVDASAAKRKKAERSSFLIRKGRQWYISTRSNLIVTEWCNGSCTIFKSGTRLSRLLRQWYPVSFQWARRLWSLRDIIRSFRFQTIWSRCGRRVRLGGLLSTDKLNVFRCGKSGTDDGL